jgi:hypothetical protein
MGFPFAKNQSIFIARKFNVIIITVLINRLCAQISTKFVMEKRTATLESTSSTVHMKYNYFIEFRFSCNSFSYSENISILNV